MYSYEPIIYENHKNIQIYGKDEEICDEFDAIVIIGPIGYDRSGQIINKMKFAIDFAAKKIMQYIDKLSYDGKVIMVISDCDIINLQIVGFYENIELFVEAVFSLKERTVNSITTSLNLVVLSKIKTDEVFYAQIDKKSRTNINILTRNFQMVTYQKGFLFQDRR